MRGGGGVVRKRFLTVTVKMYISDKFSEMVYTGYFTYYKQRVRTNC